MGPLKGGSIVGINKEERDGPTALVKKYWQFYFWEMQMPTHRTREFECEL